MKLLIIYLQIMLLFITWLSILNIISQFIGLTTLGLLIIEWLFYNFKQLKTYE
jgi:hypothetical protein